MGSALAPPPIDYRIERTIKKFNLPMKKVEILWHLFCKHDREGSGYLTMDDFFDKIIKYKRSGLTDQMFKLIESTNDSTLTFGEFVETIATFSCFEKKELLRYFFYILDSRRTGMIEKTELKHFIHGMWNHDVSSNVADGLAYLDSIDDGDGAFNFQQIESMQLHYPLVLYPLYRLQVHIITNSLGEGWWEAHKATLVDARTQLRDREQADLLRKEKAAAKDKELVNDDMLKQRMGIKYYVMPWLRGKEKARILKIAAIEAELDKNMQNVRLLNNRS